MQYTPTDKNVILPRAAFEKAEELTAVMLYGYKKVGTFNCFLDFDTKDVNVGFYQGLAGIGYELLRIYDPIEFKSVLLFK